jgi:coproporphyrinogen III oxidase
MSSEFPSPRGQRAHAHFLALQDEITRAISAVDGADFHTDEWTRPEGGGGRSRVLEESAVIEKGGVNVSAVHGEMSESFSAQVPGDGRRFFATGISLILHPRAPHAPTVHMNFRYLEKGEGEGRRAWFGGGADLTPWVLYPEDAVHFHRVWRDACGRHPGVDFAALKSWCDEYFYLPHRGETRGVGGIFFDYLGLEGPPARLDPIPLEAAEAFTLETSRRFLDAYLPILERRKDTPATEAERDWQLVRRGRYVEFNLVYDRGTVFGLKTGGRIESILVSLPNLVRWRYMHEPEPGTPEASLLEVLRQPRDWLAEADG